MQQILRLMTMIISDQLSRLLKMHQEEKEESFPMRNCTSPLYPQARAIQNH